MSGKFALALALALTLALDVTVALDLVQLFPLN